MVNVLIIFFYIIGSLLLLLLTLLTLILIIPFRYYVAGGYKNRPWIRFSLRCSPAFILVGTWDIEDSKLMQIRFILLGIPVKLDPQKLKVKEKTEKPKKDGKKKGVSSILIILDKELRIRGIALIKELLGILMPDQLYLEGKIGFEEPHLTGWLAASTHILDYCCKKAFIKLEPIWEGEHFEFEAQLTGRIMVGLILIKIGWFLLRLKTRQLFSSSEKKEPVSSDSY